MIKSMVQHRLVEKAGQSHEAGALVCIYIMERFQTATGSQSPSMHSHGVIHQDLWETSVRRRKSRQHSRRSSTRSLLQRDSDNATLFRLNSLASTSVLDYFIITQSDAEEWGNVADCIHFPKVVTRSLTELPTRIFPNSMNVRLCSMDRIFYVNRP